MRRWLPIILLLVLLMPAGPALAAEVISQEQYFVPKETTIEDDLYVSAGELIIDGRVAGDVIYVGTYIEVNGTIEGDLFALTTGVKIEGVVEDDVRLLTASAVVTGQIDGDLLATGGGGGALQLPLSSGEQTFPQGIFMRGGQIGGDALLAGGLAELSGNIDGNLSGSLTALEMREVAIGGNGDVQISTLVADEASRVSGSDGFTYSAFEPLDVPSSLSETIIYDEITRQGIDWVARLRRAVGALAGFALAGYLILRYRPQWLIAPAAVLTTAPARCFFTGLVVAIAGLFLPLVTILLSIGVGLFWGVLSGLAAGGVVIFGLILIWTFSPLIAGIWIGQRLSRRPFQAMLAGAAIIVGLTLIPQFGAGFSVIAFMAALGALILSPRMTQLPPQV